MMYKRIVSIMTLLTFALSICGNSVVAVEENSVNLVDDLVNDQVENIEEKEIAEENLIDDSYQEVQGEEFS